MTDLTSENKELPLSKALELVAMRGSFRGSHEYYSRGMPHSYGIKWLKTGFKDVHFEKTRHLTALSNNAGKRLPGQHKCGKK